jgi:hypothetical protein
MEKSRGKARCRLANFLIGQFRLDSCINRHGVIFRGQADTSHRIDQFRLHLFQNRTIFRNGSEIAAFLRIELDIVKFLEVSVWSSITVGIACVFP